MSTSDSTTPSPEATSEVPPEQAVACASNATKSANPETVNNELLDICKLSRNSRPTKFAASSWLHESPLTSIRVAGVDRDIPIPISKEDMALLKEQAERAPFGFGPETLMDQAVRDAWQVDGRNVWSESQPAFFQRTVQAMILTSLKEQLGLDTYSMDVHATLYKMLLYEEGGHFLPHRDTEKEPGMFGTYLLQIPVEGGHEGGQLCIRHVGQEVTVDTSAQSTAGAFQEVMFYADCEHELKEVTRGRRCVLAFNLCWRASGEVVGRKRKIPMSVLAGLPSSNTLVLPQLMERVNVLVDRWAAGDVGPKWVSVPLDHKYTVENLSFDGLKGKDTLMARPFLAVPSTKLAMYLVLERITFYKNYYDEDDASDEDEEGKAQVEGQESLAKMSDLTLSMVSREGQAFACRFDEFTRYTKDEKRIRSAFDLHAALNRLGDGPKLDERYPDHFVEAIEYTGNESQSEERTYFRCLLLLTPKCHESEMLATLKSRQAKHVAMEIVQDGLSDTNSDDAGHEEDVKTDSV